MSLVLWDTLVQCNIPGTDDYKIKILINIRKHQTYQIFSKDLTLYVKIDVISIPFWFYL